MDHPKYLNVLVIMVMSLNFLKDSRTNAFEDGGNDAPMTRSKDKQLGYDVDTFLYKHVQDEPSTRWIYLLEPMIV